MIYPTMSEAIAARNVEWDAGKTDLSFRSNELSGEVGEALEHAVSLLMLGIASGRAANVVKKLERARLDMPGSTATVDQLADELADIMICVRRVALHAGVDVDAAERRKFNATSLKVGLKTRVLEEDV